MFIVPQLHAPTKHPHQLQTTKNIKYIIVCCGEFSRRDPLRPAATLTETLLSHLRVVDAGGHFLGPGAVVAAHGPRRRRPLPHHKSRVARYFDVVARLVVKFYWRDVAVDGVTWVRAAWLA